MNLLETNPFRILGVISNATTKEIHEAETFILRYLDIGKNATLGDLENKKNELTEVGVLCIVTANKHDISIEITKLINPFLLHYPLSDNEELPTFAFPFSPVHADRGALYEFSLNHKLKLKDPMSIFTIKLNEI